MCINRKKFMPTLYHIKVKDKCLKCRKSHLSQILRYDRTALVRVSKTIVAILIMQERLTEHICDVQLRVF